MECPFVKCDDVTVLSSESHDISYCKYESFNENITKPSILKCGSLNTCGLKRKVLYPDFTEIIEQFDIFCVMETKLDDLGIIDINGYDFLSQPRKQNYVRKSGGLGVFFKHSLTPYVSIVHSDS